MTTERATRFLSENYVSAASMITLGNVAGGRITALRRDDAVGYANIAIAGVFTGTEDLDYLVEIEGGGEVGVATYKWSTDDGETFVATGVVTSETPTALNNGLLIAFWRGVGVDLVGGDVWRWRAYLPWGRNRMIDRDRDTEFRSSDTTVTVTFDLGAARAPRAFVLLDHNLGASATIRLQGSNDNFSTLTTDRAVAAREGAVIVEYPEAVASHRYWRVVVTDAGNADGYLRWSELYLGAYLQTPRRLELGDVFALSRVVTRSRSVTGRYINSVPKIARVLTIDHEHLPEETRDALFEAFAALFDTALFRTGPIFFHPDTSDPDTLALVQWQTRAESQSHADKRAEPERYRMGMTLHEVPRTV